MTVVKFESDRRSDWERLLPSLEPAAPYGPAAEWALSAAGVYSEASVVGTLVVWLVTLGIALNRGAYLQPGASRHYSAEYALLVGPSNTGRKSEALNLVFRLFREADVGFAQERIMHGFGSGEAMVEEVRDPMRGPDGGNDLVDEGSADKRLLICETEFSSVLTVAERESSTLSQNLRAAWDGTRLANRTKARKVIATNPHIGVIAAITPDELRRRMSADALSNGFTNRFLHVAVYRSMVEPELVAIPHSVLMPHVTALSLALLHGRKWGQEPIERSPEARERWAIAYRDELSIDRFGLAGEACARAEAHALRLQLLYALADQADRIELEHVEAALAVWRYCELSARLIYGDRTGIADADRLLEAIERASGIGLTRDQIGNEVFGKHGGKARIDAALGPLLDAGLIQQEREPTAGRPRVRYVRGGGERGESGLSRRGG